MKKYLFKIREYGQVDLKHMIIRNKKDIIVMLLEIMQIILSYGSRVEKVHDKEKIVICIDKMKRLIVCYEDKLISFLFPFNIESIIFNNEEYLKFYVANIGLEIDSQKVSILKSIFLTVIDEIKNMEECVSEIYLALDESEIKDKEKADYFVLVNYLLNLEYGYLRYDHDINHVNGLLHPEHHLDINYSANSTYKIGLDDSIDSDYLIDLLDLRTNAKFISDKN